jgi:hypothetical protein
MSKCALSVLLRNGCPASPKYATDEQLAEICNKTLSNRDRMELLYMKLVKDKRVTNREEFLGMLLEGQVTI